MKRFIYLLALIMTSCSQKYTDDVKFSIESGTDKFDFTRKTFVRQYSNRKDSITVNLSLQEKNELISIYNKYDIESFKEDYKPIPKTINLPSIPLQVFIKGKIKIRIEDGEFSLLDYFKIKKIQSFYKEIMQVLRNNSDVRKLPPSDVVFF